jgi:DHA1 family multidrug resistance protein-like MFS transporter
MSINQRQNTYILSFSLIVVMLGFGMVMPIFPFILTQMGSSGDEYGFLIALYAIMQLIFSPVWGSLSDQIGRKPVMLIGMTGVTLTLVMFGFATQLWMMFLARILSGVLASAMMPTAMAYVGDCTSEAERGDAIGKLGGAAALGVILGPGIGGWLAGDSLTLPFFIAGGLSLVSTALIAVILHESLPPQARQAADKKVKFVDLAELWQSSLRPNQDLAGDGFHRQLWSDQFPGHLWPVCLGKVQFQPAAGGHNPGGGWTGLGDHPGFTHRTLYQALWRAFVDQGDLIHQWLGFFGAFIGQLLCYRALTTGIYVLSHALLRPSVQSLTSRHRAARDCHGIERLLHQPGSRLRSHLGRGSFRYQYRAIPI